jgi:hypothetical protein
MGVARVHVWHDISGNIVAVGRPVGNARCLPLDSDRHAVLEIDVDEADILSLHRTHTVDPLRKALVDITTG